MMEGNKQLKRKMEEKKMKKRILVGLCLIAVMATGCGKKVVCDFCEEEKAGQTKMVLGKEINICNDCTEELQNGF